MRALTFKLKRSVRNNLIQYYDEPWKIKPTRQLIGSGTFLDAKKLTQDTIDHGTKVICENGKLFLVDAPRYEHNKLYWIELAQINRQLMKHGNCHPSDVGR